MNENISTTDYPTLEQQIANLIEHARHKVVSQINTTICQTYFAIGMHIVEFEQQGKDRALYGDNLLERLSATLTQRFGKGFSTTNLRQMRNFYLCYQIQQTVSAESDQICQTLSDELPNFRLSWSHYLKLMRINNPDERAFYEIEIAKNNWSLCEFQRQYDSSLYERLALSLDKENPSIGILLCADKNDSIVEITLPKDNNQIFASKYMTVLPSKEELRKLLNEKQE